MQNITNPLATTNKSANGDANTAPMAMRRDFPPIFVFSKTNPSGESCGYAVCRAVGVRGVVDVRVSACVLVCVHACFARACVCVCVV